MSWISHTRQPLLTKKDIKAIKTLPNRRYAYTSRQYTGHKYRPSSMQVGQRVFVSETVRW